MSFTIIDVVEYQYPGQIAAGNVSFRQPNDDILIAYWNVPQVSQPTEQELMDYGYANERPMNINTVKNGSLVPMQYVIDTTAQSKGYANGVSCTSYSNSSNDTWKAESLAFILWRDAVWGYLYDLLATISGNSDPIPTIHEIIAGIPPMKWPE